MTKKRIDKSILLTIIILLIVVLINILLIINKIVNPLVTNNNIKKEYQTLVKREEEIIQQARTKKTKEEMEQQELEILKTSGEKARINYYFSKYISAIEDKDYEKAYDFLYDEFKENYFKTIEEYIKYINETYPDFMVVEYDELERQGEYYILTVIIDDMINPNDETKFTQKFVFKEYNFNDFVLSFKKN